MVRISLSWRTKMKDINKEILVKNMKEMINLLEFDSMRSAGKAKLNSQHLHSMYWLLENVYNKKNTSINKEK